MQRTTPPATRVRRRNLRVAVVVADFNAAATRGLLRGALRALGDSGLSGRAVSVYHVAGSFEVAQLAMRLARTKRFSALVALGAIIRGETTHDQHLADAVTQGLLRVAHDTGVPLGLGVITTLNLKQALERSAPNRLNRGYAAAAAALGLAELW